MFPWNKSVLDVVKEEKMDEERKKKAAGKGVRRFKNANKKGKSVEKKGKSTEKNGKRGEKKAKRTAKKKAEKESDSE